MIIISRTPVRLSFFGGGTDYPDYFDFNEGAVLGTAIDKYTYISINTLSKFFDYKIRIGYSKTELVTHFNEIQHPSIRECLRHVPIDENLDIHIFSDLPAKTGLGSSSSFTVGFLNALNALLGKKTSKQNLAETACFVEQSLICENVGSQDQFHAAFGGFNIIEFKKNHIKVIPLIITREKKEFLGSHLMLFYTGLTRFASEVVEEQMKKTKERQNDAHLQKMLAMVYEAEDIIVSCKKEEMIKKFGTLLDQGWQLKKQLSSKISNQLIDTAYDKAKTLGAYGGKLCGAGSGGFLMLLAPPEKQAAICAGLNNFLKVDCHFDNDGSSIIYMKD